MASLFKPSYTVVDPETGRKVKRKARKWYGQYKDADGVTRRVPLATDKTAAAQDLNALVRQAEMERVGIVDPYREHRKRPLADHLDDWRRDILARGKTPRHADQYLDRAGKLAALARGASLADLEPGRRPEALRRASALLASILKAARLSDLTPEKIQAALAALRDAGKSHQTANHYRAALRAFVRWALDKGRLGDNPMRGVAGYNAGEDPRHPRRSLTDGELARLIRAAETGPELFGMPGPLRAMAYRAAAATGFRAEELRSLGPESFRLDGPEPTISLRASSTRNRRPAEQPVPLALARDLGRWLRDRPAGSPVFPLHRETAKAIRRDLEAAGIPYETDEGIADFHSLRAYFVSALVRSGASVKEVQTLARHAKPQTTLNHYAKVSVRDLRGAVESLPTPAAPTPRPEALAATGTEGRIGTPSARGSCTELAQTADAEGDGLTTLETEATPAARAASTGPPQPLVPRDT